MLIAILAFAMTGFAGGQVRAEDENSAENVYQSGCKNCHGAKAQGMASFPKLSDKEPDYIQMRLEQYRAGENVGPNSALMIPHATKLSDEEIVDLAEYVTTAFD